MNKHTPAPWKLLAEQKKATYAVFYADGSEFEANARLIAAAPILLDALCNLIYWVNPDGSIPDNLTVREAISEARNAIAKATGESK